VPTPLRGEAARNPFYAAIRLSEELGIEAEWERVFTAPPGDSVLMLSSWNWTLSRARRERIEDWVEAGGRLVVDNSLVGGFEEFERWSGVTEVEAIEEDEEEEEEDSDRLVEDESEPVPDDSIVAQFIPKACSALTEDGSKRALEICGIDPSRSLSSSRKLLWALRDGDKIQALRTAVGRGSVTVINATPFRFRNFLDGDHPRLFVTMAQLRHGDAVLFLTEDDRASLLALVWRFGAPVVLLLFAAVGFALWRAGARFGPRIASTESARRSLAEQIRGTGQFALRFGGGESLHAATLRALRDAAVRRFPGYDQMSSEARVAAISKVSGISADELAPAMNFSGARSSHELRDVVTVLESARRNLLFSISK
jgi:hypothetical protein